MNFPISIVIFIENYYKGEKTNEIQFKDRPERLFREDALPSLAYRRAYLYMK